MEQAVKDMSSPFAQWLDGGLDQPPPRVSDKVVSLVLPGATPPPTGLDASAMSPRDWSAALELVRETSEAIRLSEERAAELQSQLQRVTVQAAAELRVLEAQVASANQMILKAEERVRVAEQRAAEAEGWLVRLHDAVMTAFARSR